MGLTGQSVGRGALDRGLTLGQRLPGEQVVALVGNPNVGKSTVFNALTGLHQHTGNWPGKTVASAVGRCERAGHAYLLVDTPGTYSLLARSAEEEVTREFLLSGKPDAAISPARYKAIPKGGIPPAHTRQAKTAAKSGRLPVRGRQRKMHSTTDKTIIKNESIAFFSRMVYKIIRNDTVRAGTGPASRTV